MSDFGKSMIIAIVFFFFLALVSYPFSVAAAKFFLILLEVVLVVGIVILTVKIIKAYLANERVWTILKLKVAAAALALLAILIWFALRAE